VRVAKKVLSMHTDEWLTCCWDDCIKVGYDLHAIRVDYGVPGAPNVVKFVFCSDRHRAYWGNSSRGGQGSLPAGYRLSVT